jgi:hypothetical protein
MGPQSCKSPNFGNFGTPIWDKTKCHLDVAPEKRRRVYYKGEGGGFPQVWAVMSLVNPSLPMVHPNTKALKLCINQIVYFVQIRVND